MVGMPKLITACDVKVDVGCVAIGGLGFGGFGFGCFGLN